MWQMSSYLPGLRSADTVSDAPPARSPPLTRNVDWWTMLDEYEWPDALTEIAPVSAVLEAPNLPPGTTVPVQLEVKVTEIGTVELWSAHTKGPERWRLVFNVRETDEAQDAGRADDRGN